MKQFSSPSCMFLLDNEALLCGISMITKVWSNLLYFVPPMFKPIELATSRGIISKPDLLYVTQLAQSVDERYNSYVG